MTPIIRPETDADHAAVRRVHQRAFGQDDEANLVDALRAGGFGRVSLVAEVNGTVVGHVLFSELPILTDAGTVMSVSLAPLAVVPDNQRRGIGATLVRHGLDECRRQGHRIVVVLGHPEYYPRFGFSAELAKPLSSPFGNRDAWMAMELTVGALAGVSGWVEYQPPFGVGPYVRPVFPVDRAEWQRMRAALWPEDNDGQAGEVAAYFASRSCEAATFVAVRPTGGLCGFVEVSVRTMAEGCESGPVGYVEGWYVDSDMRRRGVGRMLVTAAEQWAAGGRYRVLGSDARLDNAVSHAAHLAVGFEEVERLVYYRKRLQPAASDPPGPPRLALLDVPGEFAVCKLPAGSPVPAWATAGDFFSVTRTADELSVVCRAETVPDAVTGERNWHCLRVAGSMPFTLVGVLASLTVPAAKAGVGVFAVSTFDTDYLLVKANDFPRAIAALRSAGHRVEE